MMNLPVRIERYRNY